MLVLWRFGRCSQPLIPHDGSVLLLTAWETKMISGQIRLLLSGDHVWSGFQARDSSCTQPVHRKIGADPWAFYTSFGSGLIGKNAWVASQSHPALGLALHTASSMPCLEDAPSCLFSVVSDIGLTP